MFGILLELFCWTDLNEVSEILSAFMDKYEKRLSDFLTGPLRHGKCIMDRS